MSAENPGVRGNRIDLLLHTEGSHRRQRGRRGLVVVALLAAGGLSAPGLLADLVVLDRDPFAVVPAGLKDFEVRMTLLAGEVAFQAGGEPVGGQR